MRLVGTPLLDAFPNAILNIHPSLLPAFPGVDAQRQALEHGVRFTGATVHLVTGELDGGPIVLQAAVPVEPDDTVETSVGAHPGRGAPPLPGSRPDRARRRLDVEGPAVRARLTRARAPAGRARARVVGVAVEFARRNASSNITRRRISAE